MEDKNKRGMYYITSIYMNAYLISKGFEVVKTEKVIEHGKEKIGFFYKNTDDIQETIQEFKENEELQNYITNMLKVRSTIYLQKK